jgi:hypothetical protein
VYARGSSGFNKVPTNNAFITVLKPRTSGRQRHTANAAAETIEEHFRINILYPFTDHVISHLNTRFPEEVKPMLFIAA